MSHPLEPKERDVIYYDTDGRYFRLQIEGDVMRLRVAAYFTNLGRAQKVLAPLLFAVAIYHVLSSVLGVVSPKDFWTMYFILWAVIIPWFLLVAVFPTRYALRWDFDRARSVLRINARKFASLSDIVGVVGIKQGKNRFLLALDFKNGKRKFIGNYFSTKEFSWREDAQKIADFLNVPLQIPSVLED